MSTTTARRPEAARTLPTRLDDMIGLEAALPRAERRALGRGVRELVPLDSHARIPDPTARREPVAILTAQDTTRLADLVPIRHGRMTASSFAFYRGAAALMASDLSTLPSSGITVQLCGDAHVANFGLFNGPDRRLVFDLNDFDETHPGPFDWDVKRLAASVAIAARHGDIADDKARRAVLETVSRYRTVIQQVSEVDPLRLHYFRLEFEELLHELQADTDGTTARSATRVATKARTKDRLRALSKLTEVVDGRRRFVHAPPLLSRLDHMDDGGDAEIRAFYEQYLASLPMPRRRVLERYRPVDVARKVVGVGSVGTRCLVVLCESADGEALFLQFKEATTSVLEPYLGESVHAQSGERVVQGQRIMQATGDVFLGWARYESAAHERPVDFYFRQLWDGKGSPDVERIRGRGLRAYGALCGGALALAHARTGDAAVISGYLGKRDTFDEAVADFALGYRDVNDHDHAVHRAAIEDGTITAVRDV